MVNIKSQEQANVELTSFSILGRDELHVDLFGGDGGSGIRARLVIL